MLNAKENYPECQEPKKTSLQNGLCNVVSSTHVDHYSDPLKQTNFALPHSGMFYGVGISAIGTANARIAIESSRRLVAEYSGSVDSIKFNNRVLRPENIELRCAAQGPSSVWCNCIEAGLDEYTCGYSLANSYSVGNGGTIVIELQGDDGNGLPNGQILGKTEPYIPMQMAQRQYPTLPFKAPIPIELGKAYHLVFKNLNPPSTCALSSVSLESAKLCPRNQGAIGLNGIYLANEPSNTGKLGPVYGDSAYNLIRQSSTSKWQKIDHVLSWYELQYADGTAVGQTHHGYDSWNVGQRIVEGNVHARQFFTNQDIKRLIFGLWLNFGHTSSADGSSLTIRIKDAEGHLLKEAQLGASDLCRTAAKEAIDISKTRCRDWGYIEFPETITFLKDSNYSVEFSAGGNAGFILPTILNLANYGFENRNHWDPAFAQFSSDAGLTWKKWHSRQSSTRDLIVLFTLTNSRVKTN